QTTLIALAIAGGETEEDFATVLTDRPDTEHPGFLPPAPQRLVDGVNKEVGNRLLAQIPRAKHLVLLGQRLGELTYRTFGHQQLPPALIYGMLNIPLRHPPHVHLDNEALEHLTGRSHVLPQLRAIRFLSSPNLRQLDPQHPFTRLQRPILIAVTIVILLPTTLIPSAP